MKLTRKEKVVWNCFLKIILSFLGNHTPCEDSWKSYEKLRPNEFTDTIQNLHPYFSSGKIEGYNGIILGGLRQTLPPSRITRTGWVHIWEFICKSD